MRSCRRGSSMRGRAMSIAERPSWKRGSRTWPWRRRSRMPELRIDPLSGLRVIVAGERGGRPGAWLEVEERPPIDPETDPFLEGHEDRTPPEVFALRPNGGPPDRSGWTVR